MKGVTSAKVVGTLDPAHIQHVSVAARGEGRTCPVGALWDSRPKASLDPHPHISFRPLAQLRRTAAWG